MFNMEIVVGYRKLEFGGMYKFIKFILFDFEWSFLRIVALLFEYRV